MSKARAITLLTSPSMTYVAEPVYHSLKERGVDCGKLLTVRYDQFADGEFKAFIPESIRNTDVYFFHSFYPDINKGIWELLQVNDALRRADAESFSNVLPYFACARQDRKKPREPITAALLAGILEHQGVRRLFALDLHADQIQGFFRGPFDNLFGEHIFLPYFLGKHPDAANVVAIAADVGGGKRVRAFARSAAEAIGLSEPIPFGIIDKDRVAANEVEGMTYGSGPSVEGKHVWISEDMIDTGGTALKAGKMLFDRGAASVTLMATHPLFSAKADKMTGVMSTAEEKFAASGMDVVVTGTIPRDYAYCEQHKSWLTHLPIDMLFANAIHQSTLVRGSVSGVSKTKKHK